MGNLTYWFVMDAKLGPGYYLKQLFHSTITSFTFIYRKEKNKKKIKRLHQYYLKKMKSSLYMYKILTKNKFLYYSIKYFFFSKYHIFAYQEEQQKHQLDEPFQPFFRAYLIQSTLLPLHGQISESKS